MLSTFVVDDEKIVREFYTRVFPWESIGMQLVGTASNGISALERCKELQPELVLIDIAMPGMGGLELLDLIKKELPYCNCVILTSHENFSYAQTALQLGAIDYIVKSVTTPEEMISKLQRIKNRIELIKKQTNLARVQRQWLSKLLVRGAKNLAELTSAVNQLHVPLQLNHVQVLLIEPNNSIRYIPEDNEAEISDFSLLLRLVIEKVANEIENAMWTDPVPGIFAMVKTYGDAFDENNCMDVVFNILQNELNQRVRLVGGLSGIFPSLLDLPQTFTQAKHALDSHFYLENQLIPPQPPWNPISDEIRRKLDHIIEQRDPKNRLVAQTAQDIIADTTEICSKGWFDPEETKLVVTEALRQLSRKLNVDISQWDKSLWSVQAANAANIRELKDWGMAIASRFAAAVEYQSVRPEIKRVIDAIQANLSCEGIDLTWASNIAAFHPNYFSAVFRKEIGENFSNYLNRIRIERATKYMKEGVYTDQQVAEMVGIPNYRSYFNIFLRIVGKNPTEYRQELSRSRSRDGFVA